MINPPELPCVPIVEMLKNLSVLRTTLIKSCDLHGCEHAIQEHAPSAGWIADVRTLFLRHNEQAAEILNAFEATTRKPVATEDGFQAKALTFCLQLRNAGCAAIIRDLGTAVLLATQEYAMLYSTALALEDYEIAGLQLSQLEETTPLVMGMTRVLAETAVADLGQTYQIPHAQAALRLAAQAIAKAWRPAEDAAAGDALSFIG